jgi:hypothetical protein
MQDNAKSTETTEQLLASILDIVRSEPGVRPSGINRRLNRVETDSLRATLIRRGLVRKVKVGQATHLYPT